MTNPRTFTQAEIELAIREWSEVQAPGSERTVTFGEIMDMLNALLAARRREQTVRAQIDQRAQALRNDCIRLSIRGKQKDSDICAAQQAALDWALALLDAPAPAGTPEPEMPAWTKLAFHGRLVPPAGAYVLIDDLMATLRPASPVAGTPPTAAGCLNTSGQGLTCGLQKGHDGDHSALGWGVRLPVAGTYHHGQ